MTKTAMHYLGPRVVVSHDAEKNVNRVRQVCLYCGDVLIDVTCPPDETDFASFEERSIIGKSPDGTLSLFAGSLHPDKPVDDIEGMCLYLIEPLR